MPTENELVNPRQAAIQEQIKKDAEDKRKTRVKDEKILKIGDKRVKKITYEKNVNGKWIKWNVKQIYLGNGKVKRDK
jgi:hypothetical protein